MKADCLWIKMLEASAVLNECVCAVWVTVLHTGTIWCWVMSEWGIKEQSEIWRGSQRWAERGTNGKQTDRKNRQTEILREYLSLSVWFCLSVFINLYLSIYPSVYLFISLPSISLSLPALTSLKYTQITANQTSSWRCPHTQFIQLFLYICINS